MDNLKLIPKQLPQVQVVNTGGPDDWELQMAADAIFVSRTFQAQFTVAAANVTLVKGAILAMEFTPGAVGPQTPVWVVETAGMEINASLQALGYVDDSYNILWFNGAELAAGGPAQGLFEFPGGGGGGGDTVKVSSDDTTANYLLPKLSAGDGVSLTELNPGGNERVEVSAPTAEVLTGAGNPHGSVSGVLGQHYYDTTNALFYISEGGTNWALI
jgi:hypothetical protein